MTCKILKRIPENPSNILIGLDFAPSLEDILDHQHMEDTIGESLFQFITEMSSIKISKN